MFYNFRYPVFGFQFQHTPQYLVRLLQIIVDGNCDLAVRQVASINFKNFVAKYWSPDEPGRHPKLGCTHWIIFCIACNFWNRNFIYTMQANPRWSLSVIEVLSGRISLVSLFKFLNYWGMFVIPMQTSINCAISNVVVS